MPDTRKMLQRLTHWTFNSDYNRSLVFGCKRSKSEELPDARMPQDKKFNFMFAFILEMQAMLVVVIMAKSREARNFFFQRTSSLMGRACKPSLDVRRKEIRTKRCGETVGRGKSMQGTWRKRNVLKQTDIFKKSLR